MGAQKRHLKEGRHARLEEVGRERLQKRIRPQYQPLLDLGRKTTGKDRDLLVAPLAAFVVLTTRTPDIRNPVREEPRQRDRRQWVDQHQNAALLLRKSRVPKPLASRGQDECLSTHRRQHLLMDKFAKPLTKAARLQLHHRLPKRPVHAHIAHHLQQQGDGQLRIGR